MNLIQDFTAQFVDCSVTPEGPGLIAKLYLSIRDSYDILFSTIRCRAIIPFKIHESLERNYGSLILWARSYGVENGHLDLLLRSSIDLRRMTVNLLVNLNLILTTRLVPLLSIASGLVANEDRLDAASLARSRGLAMLGCDPETQNEASQPTSSSVQVASSNMCTTTEALKELGPMLDDPLKADQTGPYPEDISEISWVLSTNLTSYILRVFPKCKSNVALGIGAALLWKWKAGDCNVFNDEDILQDGHDWEVGESYLYGSGRPRHPKLQELVNLSATLNSTPSKGFSYPVDLVSAEPSYGSLRILLPSTIRNCLASDRSARSCTETEEQWIKHLMVHIRLYICLVADCPLGFHLFKTLAEWSGHMAEHPIEKLLEQDHTCPMCTASLRNVSTHTEVMRHFCHDLRPLAADLLIPGVRISETGVSRGWDNRGLTKYSTLGDKYAFSGWEEEHGSTSNISTFKSPQYHTSNASKAGLVRELKDLGNPFMQPPTSFTPNFETSYSKPDIEESLKDSPEDPDGKAPWNPFIRPSTYFTSIYEASYSKPNEESPEDGLKGSDWKRKHSM